MKTKYTILFLFLSAACSLFGQNADYKKINLSINAGMDYPLGTSNTAGIDPDLMVLVRHSMVHIISPRILA